MTLLRSEKPAEEGDVVVAVDFGTSRSAVAYAVVGFDDELVNVITLSKAGSHVHGDSKTSSSLLVEDGGVRAFGFAAQEIFADEDRESDANWMLFKWFKMNLHAPPEGDPLVTCFGGGGSLRLSEIIQKCLEYVKDEVLKKLDATGVFRGGDPTGLFWVLTVPAIWSDYAKYMMRKAAFKAGLIASEQSCHLFLALEPECAAIASQTDRVQSRMWDVGTKFMIADCGGGTLDITSHEVVETSPLKLKELSEPQGGPFGATAVDKNFLSFLQSLLGEEMLERVAHEEPGAYLALIKEWEEKKVRFNFDEADGGWTRLNIVNLVMSLGAEIDFGTLVEEWNVANPTKIVETLKSRKVKLGMSCELMKSFFEGPITDIVDKIGDAVSTCPNLEYVVLAGGFAKCVHLQNQVQQRFNGSSVHVVLANDPDLLIVKGAAMFGARPADIVVSRKSKYTFGMRSSARYNEKDPLHRQHKDKSYVAGDGKERLQIFKIHGKVGDDLDATAQRRIGYSPLTSTQKTFAATVLVTSNYDVFHVDEPGVEELATVSIPYDMDVPFKDRKLYVEFSFGATEVKCQIFDASSENQIGTVPVEFKL